MDRTSGLERSRGLRAADVAGTVCTFVAFSVVSFFLAGLTVFLWLGPDRCFAPDPQTCADESRVLEIGGNLTLLALAVLWVVTLVRVVRTLRRGASPWTIPVVAGGKAALVLVLAVVVLSFFD